MSYGPASQRGGREGPASPNPARGSSRVRNARTRSEAWDSSLARARPSAILSPSSTTSRSPSVANPSIARMTPSSEACARARNKAPRYAERAQIRVAVLGAADARAGPAAAEREVPERGNFLPVPAGQGDPIRIVPRGARPLDVGARQCLVDDGEQASRAFALARDGRRGL